MKQSIIFYVFMLLLVVLPGCCSKLVNWGNEHFYQGNPVKPDLASAQRFIRVEHIHDQFDLIGSFVALWLSQTVRTTFCHLFAFMHGKNEQEYKALLRRQLAESDHFIQFYVLSANDITLGEVDSLWGLFLTVDGQIYNPSSVRVVDLLPEYKAIFDKKLNRFQRAYLVTFDAKSVDGDIIISPTTSSIALEFRSLRKNACMRWPVGQYATGPVQAENCNEGCK